MYRLRRLLETDALLLGVERATPADLRALEAAADECSEAAATGDVAGQLAANRRFHDRLHALARSRPEARLLDILWDSTKTSQGVYYVLPGAAAEADSAHRAIIDAVADRDATRAVALQDAHRERALERLRTSLSSSSASMALDVGSGLGVAAAAASAASGRQRRGRRCGRPVGAVPA